MRKEPELNRKRIRQLELEVLAIELEGSWEQEERRRRIQVKELVCLELSKRSMQTSRTH